MKNIAQDLSSYLTQIDFYKRIAARVSKMDIQDPTQVYLTKYSLLEGIKKTAIKAQLTEDVFESEQKFVSEQFKLVTEALKKMGIEIK